MKQAAGCDDRDRAHGTPGGLRAREMAGFWCYVGNEAARRTRRNVSCTAGRGSQRRYGMRSPSDDSRSDSRRPVKVSSSLNGLSELSLVHATCARHCRMPHLTREQFVDNQRLDEDRTLVSEAHAKSSLIDQRTEQIEVGIRRDHYIHAPVGFQALARLVERGCYVWAIIVGPACQPRSARDCVVLPACLGRPRQDHVE